MGVMKEFLTKNKTSIITGVIFISIIFFAAKSCNRKALDELHGKNEALKEQIKKAQDGTAVIEKDRLRLKDSIKLEDIKRREEQKQLKEKALASEERVKKLEEENKKAKSKIKNLSLIQVAQEINNNYGTKDATATSNSVDIKGSIPYLILETIADANSAQEVIKEKDVQIGVKDSLNKSLEEDKKALSLNLFSAEKSLNSYKEVNKLQSDLTKSLEKENLKIRKQNTFNKILIPVVGALGVFIGVQANK